MMKDLKLVLCCALVGMFAWTAVGAGTEQGAARGPIEFPIPEQVVSWPCPEFATNGVQAVWIEGVPWKGKATRVFAYYALPAGASRTQKVPGIVLVHGHGGTAIAAWVKAWVARGYAAIAMDTSGHRPNGKSWKRCRHAWSGPNFVDYHSEGFKSPKDQWAYHAVESIIRAHTFLRNLPEVDASEIGLTGISQGGTLAATVCGVDGRFAFVAPVYGAGYLLAHTNRAKIGEGWDQLWDPARYARNCRVPTFWVIGTNDPCFPLDTFVRTALDAGQAQFSVKLRLPHNQKFGQAPEVYAFADSIVKGAPKLRERKIVRHEWLSTNSNDPKWEKRPFKVSATRPAESTICVENFVTADGLVISATPEFTPANMNCL